MPSTTRKRAAPAESSSTNPVKKARGANRPAIATSDKQVEVDGATHVDDQSSQSDPKALPIDAELKTKPRRKASKKARGAVEATQPDTKTARVVKTEDQEESYTPASAVTKGRKREKAGVKEEKDSIVEEATLKKARKGKVSKREEEAEELNGEPTPKKAKGKRKTKEEKEAEAMPLAARTTGLRMFIGAHVSGAKGAFRKCRRVGNAFALFLKSQRKWENPPLQDENRDAFRSNCIEHKFDAMK
ncbi:MAG: hypothetical protein Q9224_007339 [Gallowayella concinna]